MPRFYIPETRTDLYDAPDPFSSAIEGAAGGFELGAEIGQKRQEQKIRMAQEARLKQEHADKMKMYAEQYAESKAKAAQRQEAMAAEAMEDEEKRSAYAQAFGAFADPEVQEEQDHLRALQGMKTAEGAKVLHEAWVEERQNRRYAQTLEAANAEIQDLAQDKIIDDEEAQRLSLDLQAKGSKKGDISGVLEELTQRREHALREEEWKRLKPAIQEEIDRMPASAQKEEMQKKVDSLAFESARSRVDPQEFYRDIATMSRELTSPAPQPSDASGVEMPAPPPYGGAMSRYLLGKAQEREERGGIGFTREEFGEEDLGGRKRRDTKAAGGGGSGATMGRGAKNYLSKAEIEEMLGL